MENVASEGTGGATNQGHIKPKVLERIRVVTIDQYGRGSIEDQFHRGSMFSNHLRSECLPNVSLRATADAPREHSSVSRLDKRFAKAGIG